MHRCPNRACPSRGLETLINWVQAAADIEGVGEQIVRRLWDLGLVRSIPDLYRLRRSSCSSSRLRRDLATNAVDAIEASKARRSGACSSASTSPTGWVTAQNLARHFGSVERLLEASRRR